MTTYNDFVIRFANVNGSGSASANGMFAKALFRMGVPISTRNIFPSNIEGLPTWFEVRASGAGYHGRREGVDLMVAMNAETYEEDIAAIAPGGYLLYDNSAGLDRRLFRRDVNPVGIPIAKLIVSAYTDPRQRKLFKNIVYVGALSALLNIDFDVLTGMVSTQYRGKDELIAPNIRALDSLSGADVNSWVAYQAASWPRSQSRCISLSNESTARLSREAERGGASNTTDMAGRRTRA